MNISEFAKKIQGRVADFCKTLDAKPPAYSYIPLTDDGMRIKGSEGRQLP